MKKKTLNKILIIFVFLSILISAGIAYINQVILPVKVKSLIIQKLEQETHKKVNLESLRLNLLKGLVLKNLAIYDNQKTLLELKEASCTFNIATVILGKGIIIPNIRLESPKIFLERRPDNSLNVLDLLPKKTAAPQKSKFNVIIQRISIVNARIDFCDNYISPAFNKSITDLNMDIALALPLNIKFYLKAAIPANPIQTINADGNFNLLTNQLQAKITLHDIKPNEFSPYYQNLGIKINDGLIDSLINLILKNNTLDLDIKTQNKNLDISKDNISAKLNSDLKTNIRYNIFDKELAYSGILNLVRLDLSGIEKIDKIDNITGLINFNRDGLSSDRLKAQVYGLPCQVKFNLKDFKSPLLLLQLNSDLSLSSAQKILSDKFKVILPLDLSGSATLTLNLETQLPVVATPKVGGVIDIIRAETKINNLNSTLTNINGQVTFDLNQLRGDNLNFDFSGTTYSLNAILDNYRDPDLNLKLSSDNLSLESNLKMKDKLLNINFMKGKYINSQFNLTGKLDTSNSPSLPAEISANLNINLADIKASLEEFKETLINLIPDGASVLDRIKAFLEKSKPQGSLLTDLKITGNLRNPKSCEVQAKSTSPSVSLYGLAAGEFLMLYNQANGLADISPFHFSLYDGIMEANAKINLNTKNLAYLLNLDLQGVKIEKLKIDTPAKEKDISGTVQAQTKLSGFISDIPKTTGSGSISFSEGKLWQLNLLKGLGQLLFTKDFANITFNKGYCDFLVENQTVFTDNLILNSNLVNLSGGCKIGFDGSLDASVNIQMSDEMIPEPGGIREITSVILGQAGRFAVVKISGTLSKPKYKFQPAVMDVIKSIKNLFFGGQ